MNKATNGYIIIEIEYGINDKVIIHHPGKRTSKSRIHYEDRKFYPGPWFNHSGIKYSLSEFFAMAD